MRFPMLVVLVLSLPAAARAQTATKSHDHAAHDSAFAAMQERGEHAMGVDQYTSTHHFDALADGGRITLERNVEDTTGVAQIRMHLREIARAFKAGDFSTPAAVHMKDVPGVATMAAKHDVISYEVQNRPRGAALRMVTRDTTAIRAIHQFMAFQRAEHHAPGAGG